MGDTNLIVDSLSRLKSSKQVDVLVGLDQMTVESAVKKLKWQDLRALQKKGFLGSGEYKEFVAFDWAPMAFVYNKSRLSPPPKSLDDLLSPNLKNQILLEDPRLSTPGFQFLTWVQLEKKAGAKNYLEKLKTQIHSISPSWSASYGLFKRDQAKLVFSYLSSPIYHWKEEKNENFVSSAFSHRHPLTTEWAGVPKNCQECDLSKQFLEFLISDSSQKLIMDLNYMFPVNLTLIKGSLYEKLPRVETYPLGDYKKIDANHLLKMWKDIFQ